MDQQLEKDSSLDLVGLMGTKVNESAGTDSTKKEEAAVSELDKMIAAKKSSDSTGLIVDAEENRETHEPLRTTFQSDRRKKEVNDYIESQSTTIDKIKAIVCIKKPTDEVETVEMMDEIEAVTVTDDGTVIVPEGAKYIYPKTAEIEAKINAAKESGTESDIYDAAEIINESKGQYKDGLVTVVIDKTGLGSDFAFSEEEQEKIQKSTAIHLIEVEDQSLSSIEIERPDEELGFQALVDKYQLSMSKAPMTFAASGFKAEMSGLSWAEFSDITLDISDESEDWLSFDKMDKRMNIVYTKMVNPSCGEFKDYTDFLKNFAFVDMQLAVFGLLIATEPEVSKLSLRCQMQKCGKGFEFKYSPRAIIDYTSCNVKYLETVRNIAEGSPDRKKKMYDNAAVRTVRRVKLPNSGVIIDFGMASCYDYLYNIISTIENVREKYGDDDPRLEVITVLQGVRSMKVPVPGTNTYVNMTTGMDILNTITQILPAEDVSILLSAYEHYTNQYAIGFSLKNIECPHCKHVTEQLPITPDELVFLVYQRQRATHFTFDNFTDL